jgi:hypothetical protein
MKLLQLYDGQWVTPVMRGYRMVCCDCELTHRVDFRVVHHGKRHSVEFRATRDKRATAARRKRRGEP